MNVEQLNKSIFFGPWRVDDTDRLERMSALRGEGPHSDKMFAALREADDDAPYIGTGTDNESKIVNGYRLLRDYKEKYTELGANPMMMHPKVVERQLADLNQEVLELASIIAVELFLQSDIVEKINQEREKQLEEKLRGSVEISEPRQFPQQVEEYMQHLANNRSRQIQLLGWNFDPTSAAKDGGVLWLSLKEVKDLLRAARDTALDDFDQARLSNEMAMLPSVIAKYQNDASALIGWYNNDATAHQQLAFLMRGHELIPMPVRNNPEDGRYRSYRRLLALLDSEYASLFEGNDTVQLAQQALSSAMEDCEHGLQLVRDMRQQLSRPVVGVADGILSPKLGEDLDLLIWISDNIKRPNPYAWVDAVRPWEWIAESRLRDRLKIEARQDVKLNVESHDEASSVSE